MKIEHRRHTKAFPQPCHGFYIHCRAVVLHPQTRHCVWQPALYVPKTRNCEELAPKHLFTPGRVPILNSTYKTQWADTCKSTYTPAFGFPELFLCISAMSLSGLWGKSAMTSQWLLVYVQRNRRIEFTLHWMGMTQRCAKCRPLGSWRPWTYADISLSILRM